MIKSMTGFGKISNSYPDFDVLVEIKSVNSKYFDPSFRLPKQASALDITLRNPLQEKLVRGKIDVRIELIMKSAVKVPKINNELLLCYKGVLERICAESGIDDKIKLDHYLKLPDIIEFQTDAEAEKELEEKTAETVMECAEKLDAMRAAEGAALEADLRKRLNRLAKLVKLIKNSRVDLFSYWTDKFKKRMQEMGVSDNYEERIVQEASIYGEKADITEELTRLGCHIEQFGRILTEEYPVGKKLDFLSQELHREFNTIASKSSRSDIINAVIEGKAETDRIREQVQNLV